MGSSSRVGRVVGLLAIIIGAILAPQLAMLDQVFQYIQKYSGFISPGVLAIFVMGLFWRKTTPNAALVSAILSIPLSAGMAVMAPSVPFLNRMGYVFLISVILIVIISYREGKGRPHPNAIVLTGEKMTHDPVFTVAAFGILGITAALYAIFSGSTKETRVLHRLPSPV